MPTICNHRILAITLGLYILAQPPLAVANERAAQDILKSMAAATVAKNYDGIFVYMRGDQMDAMRIIHRGAEGEEIERLVSLSGPQREIHRDGDKVTVLFVDEMEARVDRREPKELLALGLTNTISALTAIYEFSLLNSDRVAARETWVIGLMPREGHRYSYRFWVDKVSYLPLKSVIFNAQGQVLEQMQFTQIEIDQPITDEQLAIKLSGRELTWYRDTPAVAPDIAVMDTNGWQVAWLPAGFKMRNKKTEQISVNPMPVSHMIYSDGLAMISVFVEKIVSGDEPIRGFKSVGAVNTYGRVMDNHQITVVGEAPMTMIQRIAASVVYDH